MHEHTATMHKLFVYMLTNICGLIWLPSNQPRSHAIDHNTK